MIRPIHRWFPRSPLLDAGLASGFSSAWRGYFAHGWPRLRAATHSATDTAHKGESACDGRPSHRPGTPT